MPFLIPTERLLETDSLIVFNHPFPTYRVHILLLPKKSINGLYEFSPQDNQQFMMDLFVAVRKMVDQFQLDDIGYRLIVNGGKYQEIPQLHFHLVSD